MKNLKLSEMEKLTGGDPCNNMSREKDIVGTLLFGPAYWIFRAFC